MTNARKLRIYDRMWIWIVDHCDTLEKFEIALDCLGLSKTEGAEIIRDYWVEFK